MKDVITRFDTFTFNPASFITIFLTVETCGMRVKDKLIGQMCRMLVGRMFIELRPCYETCVCDMSDSHGLSYPPSIILEKLNRLIRRSGENQVEE